MGANLTFKKGSGAPEWVYVWPLTKSSTSGICGKDPDLASETVEIWHPNNDRYLDLGPVLYEAAVFLLRPDSMHVWHF